MSAEFTEYEYPMKVSVGPGPTEGTIMATVQLAGVSLLVKIRSRDEGWNEAGLATSAAQNVALRLASFTQGLS